jgi:LuxR family transcriptional regulator, maltose regulon positive regulatory protein
MLATKPAWGMPGEARACLAALDDERANSGEIGNARAVIRLAEGNPAAALAAVQAVLDDTAPVVGYSTVLEAHLLAGLAHRDLGDQRAANQAVERALGLAEPDRLVLPFAMAGTRELLEALPRHETAHAALRADILDLLHGSSLAAKDQPPSPPVEKLSPSELRVLRHLPTNLSNPQHLRQAPGPRSLLGHTARPRAAATVGRPDPLARRSPDPGDADSPASARPRLHGPSISAAHDPDPRPPRR